MSFKTYKDLNDDVKKSLNIERLKWSRMMFFSVHNREPESEAERDAVARAGCVPFIEGFMVAVNNPELLDKATKPSIEIVK